MNEILNFKRIGLILRADWIEHKRMFCVTAGLFLIGCILILLDAPVKRQEGLFGLAALVTLISYFSLVGRKIHRSQGLSLMLPASTLEKFVELIILGVAYFIVFISIYWISLGIGHVFTGMELTSVPQLFDKPTRASGLFTFLTSYLLVCYIALRKYPAGIGFTVLILFIVISARIYAFFISGSITAGKYAFVQSDAFLKTVEFLGTYFNIAMYIVSAVLLYVAYLKLKEKQVK